eukprot:SAG31_NODE_1198_length_9441_cov_3.648897_5_plen_75_part_00
MPSHHYHSATDMGKMQAQLEAVEPGAYQSFLAYIAEGRFNLHALLRHIAHREFRSALAYFNPVKVCSIGSVEYI